MEDEHTSTTIIKPKNWNWLYVPTLLIAATCVVFSVGFIKEFFPDPATTSFLKVVLIAFAVVSFAYFTYIRMLHKCLKSGVYKKELQFLEIAGYILVLLGISQVIGQIRAVIHYSNVENISVSWIPLILFISFFALMAFFIIKIILVRLKFAKSST